MDRKLTVPEPLEGDFLPKGEGEIPTRQEMIDEMIRSHQESSRSYWAEQVGVRPDGTGGFEIDNDELAESAPPPRYIPASVYLTVGLVGGVLVGSVLVAVQLNFLEWLVP